MMGIRSPISQGFALLCFSLVAELGAAENAPNSTGITNTTCEDFYDFSIEEMIFETNYSYKGYPNACVDPVEEFDDQLAPNEIPEFLTSKEMGPRSVLFYAPWCHYSQQVKKAYVSFARNVTNLLPEQNGTFTTARFYALSCQAFPHVCDEMGIEGLPMLSLIRAGSTQMESGHENARSKLCVMNISDIRAGICNGNSDVRAVQIALRTFPTAAIPQHVTVGARNRNSAVAKKLPEKSIVLGSILYFLMVLVLFVGIAMLNKKGSKNPDDQYKYDEVDCELVQLP